MTQSAALKIVGVSLSTWKRWRRDRRIPPGVCRRGPSGRWMVADADFWKWWGRYVGPVQTSPRAASLQEHLFPSRKP